MINLFAVLFYRYKRLFKDEISAIGILSYFFSLNILTATGICRKLLNNSCLSDLPVFYCFPIMLLSFVLTRYIFLAACFNKKIACEKEMKMASETRGYLLLVGYGVGSFMLMLAML